MIMLGQAMLRQDFTDQRAKPPLHAITHNRIPDSFGYRDTVADPCSTIGSDQQDQTRPRHPQAAVGRDKIGTASQDCAVQQSRGIEIARIQLIRDMRISVQADSFLRPRARRARSTLRPPTVAPRARKP